MFKPMRSKCDKVTMSLEWIVETCCRNQDKHRRENIVFYIHWTKFYIHINVVINTWKLHVYMAWGVTYIDSNYTWSRKYLIHLPFNIQNSFPALESELCGTKMIKLYIRVYLNIFVCSCSHFDPDIPILALVCSIFKLWCLNYHNSSQCC